MARAAVTNVLAPNTSDPLESAYVLQLRLFTSTGIMFGIAIIVCGILGLSIKGTTSRVMGGVALGISGFTIIWTFVSMVRGINVTIATDNMEFFIISLINHLVIVGVFVFALIGGILALASSSDY